MNKSELERTPSSQLARAFPVKCSYSYGFVSVLGSDRNRSK